MRDPVHAMMRRALFTSLLISFISAAASLASEPLPITEILTDPEPYHLKLVTLQGTVRQVKALDPYYQSSGSACYGAYTFMLEDGTGTIAVAVFGICGKPMIRSPEVADGERVTIQAHIYAPGRFGYFLDKDGQPILGEEREQVQAVAAVISRPAE
ncbi:MAG: hypothetical protein ACREI2_04960 [Nitrospiraceae bacterium]